MTCPKCLEHIFSDDELSCVECKRCFHYFCCGQTEKNFKAMKQTTKAHFKCIDCKGKMKSPEHERRALGAQNTDPETIQTSGVVELSNEYFERKFKELVRNMTENKDELIRILENRVKDMEEKLQERDNKIQDLEERMEMLESRSRICNIEIRNMPETRGEDMMHLVNEIGKTIGIQDMKEGDVQVAHRVDSRNSTEKGKRPIIVHLGSRYLRNKWLTKFREYKRSKNGGQTPGNLTARDVNSQLPDNRIFINEHLTVQKKILLNEAKGFAKANGIKYVWTKEGSILIKKNETEKVVRKINTRRDFESFKNNYAI
ncbi:hypothetical protein M8J76_010996 [Diaphorina citri]|nr:hypothetical protein M8J76_010996 [Diaphorina citri]